MKIKRKRIFKTQASDSRPKRPETHRSKDSDTDLFYQSR